MPHSNAIENIHGNIQFHLQQIDQTNWIKIEEKNLVFKSRTENTKQNKIVVVTMSVWYLRIEYRLSQSKNPIDCMPTKNFTFALCVHLLSSSKTNTPRFFFVLAFIWFLVVFSYLFFLDSYAINRYMTIRSFMMNEKKNSWLKYNEI